MPVIAWIIVAVLAVKWSLLGWLFRQVARRDQNA